MLLRFQPVAACFIAAPGIIFMLVLFRLGRCSRYFVASGAVAAVVVGTEMGNTMGMGPMPNTGGCCTAAVRVELLWFACRCCRAWDGDGVTDVEAYKIDVRVEFAQECYHRSLPRESTLLGQPPTPSFGNIAISGNPEHTKHKKKHQNKTQHNTGRGGGLYKNFCISNSVQKNFVLNLFSVFKDLCG